MKKNQLLQMLFFVTLSIFLGFMIIYTLVSFKNMIKEQKSETLTNVSLPIIKKNNYLYNNIDYDKLIKDVTINTSSIILENKQNSIVISSKEITDEKEIRDIIMHILSTNKDIYISSFCGTTTDKCNNKSFIVTLKGEKIKFIVE